MKSALIKYVFIVSIYRDLDERRLQEVAINISYTYSLTFKTRSFCLFPKIFLLCSLVGKSHSKATILFRVLKRDIKIYSYLRNLCI